MLIFIKVQNFKLNQSHEFMAAISTSKIYANFLEYILSTSSFSNSNVHYLARLDNSANNHILTINSDPMKA